MTSDDQGTGDRGSGTGDWDLVTAQSPIANRQSPLRLHRQAVHLLDAFQPISALIDDGLFMYRRAFLRFLFVALRCSAILVLLAQVISAIVPRVGRGGISVDVFYPALYGLLLLYFTGVSAGMVGIAGERPERRSKIREDGVPSEPRHANKKPLFVSFVPFVDQKNRTRPAQREAGSALQPSRVAQIIVFVGLYVAVTPLVFFALTRAGQPLFETLQAIMGPAFWLVNLSSLLVLRLYGPMLVIAGMLYLIQPWLHESRPFGDMVRRSVALAGYRLGCNLLACGLTALLATIAVALALLVDFTLIERASQSLPFRLLLGRSLRLYTMRQIWIYAVLMPSLALTLPPLPIWMALLYRRNRDARDGADLSERIVAWQRMDNASCGSGDLHEHIIPLTIEEPRR